MATDYVFSLSSEYQSWQSITPSPSHRHTYCPQEQVAAVRADHTSWYLRCRSAERCYSWRRWTASSRRGDRTTPGDVRSEKEEWALSPLQTLKDCRRRRSFFKTTRLSSICWFLSNTDGRINGRPAEVRFYISAKIVMEKMMEKNSFWKPCLLDNRSITMTHNWTIMATRPNLWDLNCNTDLTKPAFTPSPSFPLILVSGQVRREAQTSLSPEMLSCSSWGAV